MFASCLPYDKESIPSETFNGDVEGHMFSAMLALSMLAGYADIPGYELTFSIVQASIDGQIINEFYDGRETTQFFNDSVFRSNLCEVVQAQIPILIDMAKPNLIHMSTHTANLPTSALRKYNRVCSIIRDLGFDARPGDSYHGRHIWMMQRLSGT